VIATLEVNKGAGDEAAVIGTTFPDQRKISLAISSLENGDAEIHLRPDDCERVVDHLREAFARL
jgi:hypothetical protein